MSNYAANNREERTEFSIYYSFYNDEHNFEEEELIYIPFDILMSAVTQFCLDNYEVNLDGKDTSVWNLFAGTDFIENLFDDDDFVDLVTEKYRCSYYIDMDYDNWAELEPWGDYEDDSHVIEPGLYTERG